MAEGPRCEAERRQQEEEEDEDEEEQEVPVSTRRGVWGRGRRDLRGFGLFWAGFGGVWGWAGGCWLCPAEGLGTRAPWGCGGPDPSPLLPSEGRSSYEARVLCGGKGGALEIPRIPPSGTGIFLNLLLVGALGSCL